LGFNLVESGGDSNAFDRFTEIFGDGGADIFMASWEGAGGGGLGELGEY
jgi:hypothetical protein